MMQKGKNPFPRVFNGRIQKANTTKYYIAHYTGLDQSYITRLASGERVNPSRDVVVKIGCALAAASGEITIQDVNILLLAAGHAPLLGRGQRGLAA